MTLLPGARAPEQWRALIAERLGTGASAEPQGDYDLNPSMRDEAPDDLTPAAVLIPIIVRPEGATVLLTLRTDHLRDHAGQVSFPGGRVEPDDDGPVATALRETEEEIGLARSLVEVVGELEVYETRTGFRITPIVGMVEPGFTLTLDAFEVAEAFEVPLAIVLDPANFNRQSRMWRGARRTFYVLTFEDRLIWGATAGMLVNLSRRLAE
jgi:8-oxo-dGTP pyrophosphatase MutT (NUDIX family)